MLHGRLAQTRSVRAAHVTEHETLPQASVQKVRVPAEANAVLSYHLAAGMTIPRELACGIGVGAGKFPR